jgi:hypothetical protein
MSINNLSSDDRHLHIDLSYLIHSDQTTPVTAPFKKALQLILREALLFTGSHFEIGIRSPILLDKSQDSLVEKFSVDVKCRHMI